MRNLSLTPSSDLRPASSLCSRSTSFKEQCMAARPATQRFAEKACCLRCVTSAKSKSCQHHRTHQLCTVMSSTKAQLARQSAIAYYTGRSRLKTGRATRLTEVQAPAKVANKQHGAVGQSVGIEPTASLLCATDHMYHALAVSCGRVVKTAGLEYFDIVVTPSDHLDAKVQSTALPSRLLSSCRAVFGRDCIGIEPHVGRVVKALRQIYDSSCRTSRVLLLRHASCGKNWRSRSTDTVWPVCVISWVEGSSD